MVTLSTAKTDLTKRRKKKILTTDYDSDEEESEVRYNCIYKSDCHGWIHVFDSEVSATHPAFEMSNGYYCPTCA
jgi:hypothetical protein